MARAHIEEDIQKALVTHLTNRGARGLVFWHTPNGGRRNAREGGRFKAMGVRPGVSDLVLVHNEKIYALELKSPKGRASESQLQFLTEMGNAGAYTCICDSIDRALGVLEMWGLLVGKTA